MNTQATLSLRDILDDQPLSIGNKVYFRERFKAHLHSIIADLFMEKEADGRLTRADLARKVGKRPEQITRILNTSGNLRLETISDILLALGYEAKVNPIRLVDKKRNYCAPEWLSSNNYDYDYGETGLTIPQSLTPDIDKAYMILENSSFEKA